MTKISKSKDPKNFLEIINLKKYFRSHWLYRPLLAVKDISLEVLPGEAFGFLGHNGAGKTTTIKCMVGLIHKTSGQILLEGKPLEGAEQKQKIGYLPEHPYFYDHLSVEETLDFLATLYGIPKQKRTQMLTETLARVGLTHKKNSKVRALSKGLQQRLGIAQAIIHSPKLLILDEPFSGLDPVGRKEIRELILAEKASGTTIFMSSHILTDVEDICERVSILSQGEIKTTFHISEIAEKYGEAFQISVRDLDTSKEPGAAILTSAETYRTEKTALGEIYKINFSEQAQAEQALKALIDANSKVLSFSHSGANLEDIFMRVTGESYKPEERHSIDKTIES